MPNRRVFAAPLIACAIVASACRGNETQRPVAPARDESPAKTHDATVERAMSTLPTVRTLADIAPNAGKRATIEGVLRRVPLRKGDASHPATALFLSDGTQIWVSYGDIPAGWEGFVDKPIVVEATVWKGPPPGSKQAVGGPHVSDWGAPRAP
jgi:hypothetical protein